MEWLAFIAGVLCGYIVRNYPAQTTETGSLAVRPLAKLKKPDKRAPKYNDDKKALALERGTIGGR